VQHQSAATTSAATVPIDIDANARDARTNLNDPAASSSHRGAAINLSTKADHNKTRHGPIPADAREAQPQVSDAARQSGRILQAEGRRRCASRLLLATRLDGGNGRPASAGQTAACIPWSGRRRACGLFGPTRRRRPVAVATRATRRSWSTLPSCAVSKIKAAPKAPLARRRTLPLRGPPGTGALPPTSWL